MTQFRPSRLFGLFAAVAAIGAPSGGAFAGAPDLPPAAKPGECYGRVYAPPVYGKTGHKVLVRPASTETRVLPGRKVVVKTPAVYGHESSRTVVKAGGLAWERVFCGGKLEPDFIRKVQAALAQRGYDPGPVDGEARPETYAALRKFQAAAGLSQGQLTIATAKALGVW